MRMSQLTYTVKELESRYRLTRSNIYNRINGLKNKGYELEPLKQGQKSIFNADHVALLDRLNEHLDGGNDIASFPDIDGRIVLSQPPARSISQPIERLTGHENGYQGSTPAVINLGNLLETLSTHLAAPAPAPALDPLANLRSLQDAYKNDWLLSSSQLKALIGVKPPSGASFSRYGFTFTRRGKNGAESAWQLTKD